MAAARSQPGKVLELSGSAPGTKIAEVPLDAIFSTQTEGDEGQGEEERDRVERFKGLRALITDRPADVRAFRVGEVNVRYYVVGRTTQGDWAGIWTEAVET
jgi:hypothetical protein